MKKAAKKLVSKKVVKKTARKVVNKVAKKVAKKAVKKSAPTKAVQKPSTSPVVIEGKKAPSFKGHDHNGEKLSLKDYSGKKLVLYFYPKDDTPGCTIEACSFRDEYDSIRKLGAEVLGVSPDNPSSHTKFIGKYQLPFRLLADEGSQVCESYGLWVQKAMYGKTFMGVQRATVLIGEDGKVLKFWPKVKPADHVAQVLEALAD